MGWACNPYGETPQEAIAWKTGTAVGVEY